MAVPILRKLDKADAGLGAVDNTSDANKPISADQAIALAGKASKVGPVLEDLVVLTGNSGNSVFFALRNTITGGRGYSFFSSGGGPSPVGTFGIFDEAVGSSRLLIGNSGELQPGGDNIQSLGSAGRRWSQVFAGNGTINTSDEREKTPVSPMTDAELAAAKDLAREIGMFQWLASVEAKGDGARVHIGMTVQRCIEVMAAHGLEATRYGFVCYDEWGPTEEMCDPDTGDVVQPARPAGNRYGFRMDQLMAFIARGLDARLAALEGK